MEIEARVGIKCCSFTEIWVVSSYDGSQPSVTAIVQGAVIVNRSFY